MYYWEYVASVPAEDDKLDTHFGILELDTEDSGVAAERAHTHLLNELGISRESIEHFQVLPVTEKYVRKHYRQ